MMLKRIVSISLISTLTLMGIIMTSGLLLPASVTNKFTNKQSVDTQVVALDASGKPIEGATVQQNADGTQTVVDQNGTPVPNAAVSDPSSATPTPTPTPTPAPAPTPTPTPTPSPKPTPSPTPTPTPAPKPTPTPTPTPTPPPAPAPTYCGGKTPCYGRGDLAAHASTNNCWSYQTSGADSVVYNMSGFAPRHSGGSSVILTTSNCGKAINWSGAESNSKHTAAKTNSQGTFNNYKVGFYDASKP